MDSVYSKRIRAGKRRTYFFDVRTTRGNDYYLTITESRKRFNDDGYDRHKIFLYKEDFNFDAFNHEYDEEGGEGQEGGYSGGYSRPVSAPVVSVEAAEAPTEETPISSSEDTSTSQPSADEFNPSTSSVPQASDDEFNASTPSTPSTSEGDNGASEEVDKW